MSAPAAKAAVAEAASGRRGCCCCCGGGGEIVGMAKSNQRKCRDMFCCLLFLVFWIGMVVIGAIGLKYGNPERLVYGTDYTGAVCGMDARSSLKYTVYPRLQQDYFLNLAKSSPLDYTFYGVCVSSCPGTLEVVCNYNVNNTVAGSPYTNDVLQQCIVDNSYTPPAGVNCNLVNKNCWITPIQTASVLHRCVPVYNTSYASDATCVYPTGMSAYNPACVLAQSTRNTVTQYPAQPNQLFDAMNTVRQTLGRWFGDLARAWWVILLCAVGVTVVFAFVWLLLAKWLTGVFVWGTIILVVIAMSLLTGYFYYKGGLINLSSLNLPSSVQSKINSAISAADSASDTASYAASFFIPPGTFNDIDNQSTYRIIAYVFTAITIITLLLVIALRRSIKTAIKTIKMGARALQELPTLLCFPLTTVIALGVFLIWWVFVAASLATAGKEALVNGAQEFVASMNKLTVIPGVTNETIIAFQNSPGVNDTFTVLEDYPAMTYTLIYHFFGLLWTTQFISGVGMMSMAGAICAWYFSRVPSSAAAPSSCNPFACCCGRAPAVAKGVNPPRTWYDIESWPILASFGRTLRYYLGTVAFGSLLIAILQFIRAVLAYINRKMTSQAKRTGQDTTMLKFVGCCISCCLWCIQKCVEMVTRNAYIFTAMRGTSFCESAGSVFRVLTANTAVIAAVNIMSEIIMFLGKLLIAVGSTWVAYAIVDNVTAFQPGGANQLSSTWLVILVTFFFAYVVASAFMIVFDIAVDSVLLCYLQDMTDNGGKPMHMAEGTWEKLQEKDDPNAPAPKKLVVPDASPAGKRVAAPVAAGPTLVAPAAASGVQLVATTPSQAIAPAGSAAAYA